MSEAASGQIVREVTPEKLRVPFKPAVTIFKNAVYSADYAIKPDLEEGIIAKMARRVLRKPAKLETLYKELSGLEKYCASFKGERKPRLVVTKLPDGVHLQLRNSGGRSREELERIKTQFETADEKIRLVISQAFQKHFKGKGHVVALRTKTH